MMKTTDNERKVLQAIYDSEYQDGFEYAGHHVWTDYINPFPVKTTLPGVVSSLVKKGFVSVYRGTTSASGEDGSTIALTALGVEHVPNRA
jgi:hypothetical protein